MEGGSPRFDVRRETGRSAGAVPEGLLREMQLAELLAETLSGQLAELRGDLVAYPDVIVTKDCAQRGPRCSVRGLICTPWLCSASRSASRRCRDVESQ